MNVLNIAWDPAAALTDDLETISGDVRNRLIEYGKYVESFHVVTYTNYCLSLKQRKIGNNVFVYPTSSLNALTYLFDALKISINLIKKIKIDIITAQDPYLSGLVGFLLKKMFGLPLVIQIHGDEIDRYIWLKERKANYLLNGLGKYLIKKADSIRVDSSDLVSYFIDKGIPKEHIFLIPVYIFTKKFFNNLDKSKFSEEYGKYDNIILYVGRLSIEKNIPLLLKSAKTVLSKFPNTLFLILGTGPELEQLKRLAINLKIEKNVVFKGPVPHKEISGYYAICDIFVIPSTHEGRSIALAEAIASGCPVISTDVSGARDVVDDGYNGYIIPLNDKSALEQRIIKLLSDLQLRKIMGNRGRSFAHKELDIEQNAFKLAEMYHKVITRTKSKK